MSNPSDPQPFKREVYTDAAVNVHANEIRYRNGLINGQLIEEEHLFAQRAWNRNMGPGLVTGIILATILGIGGVWYLVSHPSQEPVQQIMTPGNDLPRSTLK